jgi:TusA-related sulfurtransferase
MTLAGKKEEVVELDIQGQVCPACLLVVLKEINNRRDDLRSGRTRLVVRTDHRNATRTVPDSARKMGYAVEVEKMDSYYQITVGRKT